MSTNFKIESKRHNGDWHIMPVGDFDGSSAWELINLLTDKYNGEKRVLIETRNLRTVRPFGCSMFQCQFHQCRIPTNRIVFKGEKGHALAPKGCQVVAEAEKHKCRCNGNCAHCRCAEEKNQKQASPRRISMPMQAIRAVLGNEREDS